MSAFSRTFANRDLFSGPALGAVIWSILAALLLAGMLISVGLLAGLLTEQGHVIVRLTPDELDEFNRTTGLHLRHVGARHMPAADRDADDAAEGKDDASEEAPEAEAQGDRPLRREEHQIEGEGIIGSVWRTHRRWYGPAFAWVYRHFDLLRNNDFALVALLVAAISCWLLRYWCLKRIVYHSRVAALRIAVMFRRNLHRQAMRLSPEDIDEQSSQAAIQLFTTQVDAVRSGLENWITRIARYPLELFCVLFIAWNIDSRLAIEWALPLSLCWFLVERARSRLAAAMRLTDDRLQREYQALSEQLQNARLVRGFGMEQAEHEEFLKRLDHTLGAQKDLFPSQREAIWLHRLTAPICAVILLFLSLSLGWKILHGTGQITLSGAIVFLMAVTVALRAARELWVLESVRDDIAVAADQIFRYLDRLPSVSQAVGAKFLNPLSRSLHFDAVTYRTPSQRMLLDRVTLKLDAKKTYAVVSLDPLEAKAFTLLLPRFLEPQSGRVLFDGEDIAWATLESLRAEAVFVGGDDPPLRGTVLDNLRAGNTQYTLPQATEAAKEVHAHNFLVRLPQGYETVLSGADDELDASQRFRLALARAVLRNPALLIIEEPQTAFDEDTKQLLDDAYQRILPGRTVLFLPSRLSTLKRADQIIFVHNGQIVAQGPQAEVVSASPFYRHWEYLHFNEFRRQELADRRG